MSDETTSTEPADEQAEEASEPSRIAGGIVVLILAGAAALVMKVVVTAAPYVAYFVAGILVCHGWHRARAWVVKRRGTADDETEDEDPPDVGEALRHLGRNGDHVLLTQLRKRLRMPDTKAVRALLKAEGIRVRDGVRTPEGNGPGVHHDDIPAPPPEVNAGHSEGCCCSSEPTTPAPTTDPDGAVEEGLRVEPIGQAGAVIRDPADAVRYHRVQ